MLRTPFTNTLRWFFTGKIFMKCNVVVEDLHRTCEDSRKGRRSWGLSTAFLSCSWEWTCWGSGVCEMDVRRRKAVRTEFGKMWFSLPYLAENSARETVFFFCYLLSSIISGDLSGGGTERGGKRKYVQSCVNIQDSPLLRLDKVLFFKHSTEKCSKNTSVKKYLREKFLLCFFFFFLPGPVWNSLGRSDPGPKTHPPSCFFHSFRSSSRLVSFVWKQVCIFIIYFLWYCLFPCCGLAIFKR